MSSRRPRNSSRRIASIVAREVAAVIPTLLNHLNNGTNGGGANTPPLGCSFKKFSSCNPTKFNGTEGATSLLQWFESTENTFLNSECPDNLKVRHAASVLQKRALTWWNGEKRTRGVDAAMALSWDQFKDLMTKEFCPRNEIKKLEAEFWDLAQEGGENLAYTNRFHELSLLVPHLITPLSRAIEKYIGGLPMQIQDTVWGSNPTTLEDTIRLAAQLTDNHVKNGTLIKKGGKKNSDISTSKSDQEDESEYPSKKRKTKALTYAAVTPAVPVSQVAPMFQQAPIGQVPTKKPYTGPHPQCNTCKYHHAAHHPCRQCTNCGHYGHTFNLCRSAPKAPVNPIVIQPPPAITQGRACFQCGDPNHLRNQCPQLVNANRRT
ncbi:hypothetical protein QVD17_19546 [Tagetes erecta]|uniref:CCHC-type domain-containing protein n=1 Tax=Tagetes erecta TaxID=13708 RepID=A0AAD8KR64_TARER|nr:hypothetical protein QVD17_19546 [Tagetes erecta]